MKKNQIEVQDMKKLLDRLNRFELAKKRISMKIFLFHLSVNIYLKNRKKKGDGRRKGE